jgi:hypothetical protein
VKILFIAHTLSAPGQSDRPRATVPAGLLRLG